MGSGLSRNQQLEPPEEAEKSYREVRSPRLYRKVSVGDVTILITGGGKADGFY